MILLAAGRGLLWQTWDEVYVVYQPSSGETHVFNETTVSILRSLERGPCPASGLKACTEAALGLDHGELAADQFRFAVERLDELGLIDCQGETIAVQ